MGRLSMRNCSGCGISDRPEAVEGERCTCNGGDCLGHSPDCRKIEHFVKKDIRLGTMTPRMKQRGWEDRGLWRGKPAIQRLLCVPCIQKQAEVDEIERYKRKLGEEAEGSEMTMYQILCS